MNTAQNNSSNQIARFATAEEANTFAAKFEVLGVPHPSKGGFILISFVREGVCAAHQNGMTGEVLSQW